MVKPEYIILHCSASDVLTQRTFEAIKRLHTAPKNVEFIWGKYHTNGRGWREIGYNWVVVPSGLAIKGRSLAFPGAHTLGYNGKSIGVCVAGDKAFTSEQIEGTVKLVKDLMLEYNIPIEKVLGHYEVDTKGKTCPNINMDGFRLRLQE